MYTVGVVIKLVWLILNLYLIFKVKDKYVRWFLLALFCIGASNIIYRAIHGQSLFYNHGMGGRFSFIRLILF